MSSSNPQCNKNVISTWYSHSVAICARETRCSALAWSVCGDWSDKANDASSYVWESSILCRLKIVVYDVTNFAYNQSTFPACLDVTNDVCERDSRKHKIWLKSKESETIHLRNCVNFWNIHDESTALTTDPAAVATTFSHSNVEVSYLWPQAGHLMKFMGNPLMGRVSQ